MSGCGQKQEIDRSRRDVCFGTRAERLYFDGERTLGKPMSFVVFKILRLFE
jgi:hypothetical protein